MSKSEEKTALTPFLTRSVSEEKAEPLHCLAYASGCEAVRSPQGRNTSSTRKRVDPPAAPTPPPTAHTLGLAILLVSLIGHPWYAASGQTVDQASRPSSADTERHATDAAWSQRIILASGDSFIGTLSGWNDDDTWTFDVVDPAAIATTIPSPEDRPQRIVAASDLVRYGAIPQPKSAAGVLFVDGSELPGRIVELSTDRCRLVSRWFDVTIPLESVRSLLFHAPIDDDIRQHQLQAARRASGADDVVLLIDEERREGTLRLPESSVSPQRVGAAVELRTGGGESVSIPFRRIRSIILSPILREGIARQSGAGQGSAGAESAPPTRMRIGLIDGSVLTVDRRAWMARSDSSSIVLECGVELTGRRTFQETALTEDIAMLAPTPLHGSCLAVEPPLRYRHLPFFGDPQSLVRWTVDQDGPALAGRRYPNGLMMRTAARAVYPANAATRLTGAVVAAEPDLGTATDIQIETNLGVRFRVQASSPEGDVEQLWDSGVVRPGRPPVPFDVDISGASLIILATDPADSGDFGDRAVWLDLVAAGGDTISAR